MHLTEQYRAIRNRTEQICKPLKTEDYVVQPVVDVSPPKWHLGHTTWFFETFLLKPHFKGYKEVDPNYNFVFNSYYESIGARVVRTDRGNLSRPSVEDIYAYRKHVDEAMELFLSGDVPQDLHGVIALGFNHEQQHQELLYTDIKYILGHNPLLPAFIGDEGQSLHSHSTDHGWLEMPAGMYDIGYDGDGFCFDNELTRHTVYLQPYRIDRQLVTNGAYIEFINDGGYEQPTLWHSEGWEWQERKNIHAPMFWHKIDDRWYSYTLQGLRPLNMDDVLCHVNFYEAAAYAAWKGKRLPTEFEWEAASSRLKWGHRWEWTNSAYLPYPGYKKAAGAMGEYNGKFMVNQMVLRGASEVTPEGHSRPTYRNFFHPYLQWQYTGIRLAE